MKYYKEFWITIYIFSTKKMPGEFSARYCFIINYDFKQNENLVILFLILLKFDFKFYNQKSHLVPEILSKSWSISNLCKSRKPKNITTLGSNVFDYLTISQINFKLNEPHTQKPIIFSIFI